MNLNETTKTDKNTLSVISLPFVVAALFIGFSISLFTNQRQYTPEKISKNDLERENASSDGMKRYFFDARKNPLTNKMDYPNMLAAYNADMAMGKARRSHSYTTPSLPAFNWNSLGPTGIGGSASSVLVDNLDPTHQTIFAGFFSGGIWKSINGGSTWGNNAATIAYSQEDTMASINISCIAQDANGVLYVGTGDDFPGSEGELGTGIFKSTDDGTTWTQISSTIPTPVNTNTVAWAYVNRIAVSSSNTNLIYAATNLGVYISHNGGLTWRPAVKIVGANTISMWRSSAYNCYDIKISNDGSVVVAGIGSSCNTYLCYTGTNDSLFIEAPTSGAGHINGNASRIEYAISPTDPNRIYASEIAAGGSFCLSVLSGIYMCENAKTSGNGGYWYDIGPGGSTVFDPYLIPNSTDDQAVYDNALGVSSTNEGELLAGGTTLWEWLQANPSDTVGSWTNVSDYSNIGGNDPRYIHPDHHAITFDPSNGNVVYLGCDGGIYKSINNAVSWSAYNRNFVVTQFYSLCFAPVVNYVNVNIGNSTTIEGIGMGGGTQDNGSLYMNGNGSDPDSATDLTGGDGGGCAVSEINPNIAYFCADYGYLLREPDLPNLSAPQMAYNSTKGICLGGNIDSVYENTTGNGAANFIFPIALYENRYDTLNSDSMQLIAFVNYNIGDTIHPYGINGSYPYILKQALSIGDTIKVPDRVVSRLAIGFTGSYGGIWINGQGASNNAVIWKPIGGPDSKPDAFTSSNSFDSPHALAWSPDGDALFVGTEEGTLFRFSNLNKVVAGNYCSGALWWSGGGIHATGDNTVVSNNIAFSGIAGRVVLSIDVDPLNGNNVLVTLGDYGGATVQNVWYSTNALGAATFTNVQGNLPPMPVYSGIADVLDSTGHSIPGSAMVATEHGIYSTANINASSVVWVKNNNGMANCLTMAIKQQTLPTWEANNSGVIYLATFGRGIWNTTDLYPKIPDAAPTFRVSGSFDGLKIYPNPMTTGGNIEFNLPCANNLTVTIYNMQGKVVKELQLGTQIPGNHIIPLGTAEFPSGTYFASVTGNNFKKAGKFVIVK